MTTTARDHNLAVVVGHIVGEPRLVPSTARSILSFDVHAGDGPTATRTPVTWLDPPARRLALSEGRRVVVVGHVARRFFRVDGRTVARTDLVADEVLADHPRNRRARQVRAAVEQLDGSAGD